MVKVPSTKLDSAFRLYTPEECTGHKGYPPEWHETLKHAVREQAGHRCIRCGHPYMKGDGEWSRCDEECRHGGPIRFRRYDAPEHSEWTEIGKSEDLCLPGDSAGGGVRQGHDVEARYRILTVHHLDGNKGNCRWWNLTSLCQRCHLTIQGKVVMDRRWPFAHTEWFRPYVAGYYAHVYLNEDLTREQAEARLDELLVLEPRQLEIA